MATIDRRTRTLFFTTSPRTPMKMVPEIRLLTERFSGRQWARNPSVQAEFMMTLFAQDFFQSDQKPKNPAWSARDRITRAPKALGFVNLEPAIELTPAGRELIESDMPAEVLLRQLVKFQLPSPYHTLAKGTDQDFFVRPYLEMLRLVRHFGSLTFDEVKLFGMQLTNYSKFDMVVGKIEEFRRDKAKNEGRYKNYLAEVTEREVREIYAPDIEVNDISTRESDKETLEKFINTKANNMRDYTDACFRYLRATEVVSISQSGHSLSIAQDRMEEVDYLLVNMPREPIFVDNVESYKKYLFDALSPVLLTDDREVLETKIASMDCTVDTSGASVLELKRLEQSLRRKKKEAILNEQIRQIKDCRQYSAIQETFDGITAKKYYDNPLMFEWNTWRAMTMIDGGNIRPNFSLDDSGEPLSTAVGNMPDILCSYDDFDLLVEVTLQTGQRQFDNESEPVPRHLGNVKKRTGRDTFCLFVAPTINDATIAHFYSLHKTSVEHYGGKAVIIPMTLSVYRKMLEDSYTADYVPSSRHIRRIFDRSVEIVENSLNEKDWYAQITDYALNWLAA